MRTSPLSCVRHDIVTRESAQRSGVASAARPVARCTPPDPCAANPTSCALRCCVLLVAAIFLLEIVKHKSGGRVLPPAAESDKKR